MLLYAQFLCSGDQYVRRQYRNLQWCYPRKGLTGQGSEYSSHLWQEIIRNILIYVVHNKAFSIASKNTEFTINIVPVTAKSADRTLLDFNVFGESEQTGAMTSKFDDHSLA